METRRFLLGALAGMLLVLAFLTLSAITARADFSATAASKLDVVISEIAWMGTSTSSFDEWIELYNNTASSIDLTGWSLSAADDTPTITLNGTIPAHGHFLLERTDDTTVPGVPADQTYTGALENVGEDLILRDGSSNLIDRVDCSSEWFAGHADGRVPMVRVNTAVDGSLDSNWTYNPRCGSATNSTGASHTCPLTTTYVSQPFTYSVYFNPWFSATMTTTATTQMEDALLGLIGGADTTIDIALYGLNRQSVVDALVAARNGGVIVRVVGDDEAAAGEYSSFYQQLTDAGVSVVTDTSTSKIQHNKFLVVDGEIVWTGSTNFTDTGFTLNANNSIAITDTTLAGVYTTEFEEMWAGTFQDDKADNTPHLLDYNGTGVESFFSPTDLVAFEVWDELASADETVHFGMFFWTDDVLAERAVERIRDGVEVYGVWDRLGASNVSSVDGWLCAAGAQIKLEDFMGKLHHKFAVIDVAASDPVVILGSYNWTDSGGYDNDENTLIIHDRALAEAYYAEWQRLWAALGPETLCERIEVYLPLVMSGVE